MNQFYREKPFLISAFAPFLVIYGIIGILYCFGNANEASGIQNLINTIVGFDAYRDKKTMMFLSVLRVLGGLGLWQLKYWGAALVIGVFGFSIFLEYKQSLPNKYALTIYAAVIFIVAMHYRDYEK